MAAKADPNIRREVPSEEGIVVDKHLTIEKQRALEAAERDHINRSYPPEMRYIGRNYSSIYRFDNVLHALLHQKHEVEIVKMVLEHITDINARDVFDDSPLHLALYNIDVLKVLLKKGANPLLYNAKGQTPLQQARAVRRRNSDVIKALEDAEENARSQRQLTWGRNVFLLPPSLLQRNAT